MTTDYPAVFKGPTCVPHVANFCLRLSLSLFFCLAQNHVDPNFLLTSIIFRAIFLVGDLSRQTGAENQRPHRNFAIRNGS